MVNTLTTTLLIVDIDAESIWDRMAAEGIRKDESDFVTYACQPDAWTAGNQEAARCTTDEDGNPYIIVWTSNPYWEGSSLDAIRARVEDEWNAAVEAAFTEAREEVAP